MLSGRKVQGASLSRLVLLWHHHRPAGLGQQTLLAGSSVGWKGWDQGAAWQKGCSSSLGSFYKAFLYKRCSSQSQGVHPHDLIPSQSHRLRFQHRNFTGTQTCRPQRCSPPDSLLELLNQAVCLQRFEASGLLSSDGKRNCCIYNRPPFLVLLFHRCVFFFLIWTLYLPLLPLHLQKPHHWSHCRSWDTRHMHFDLGSVWTLGRYLNPWPPFIKCHI